MRETALPTGPHGLGAADVVMAYQLLFDRNPESLDVVAHHVLNHSLKSLSEAMRASDEFRVRCGGVLTATAAKPLDWPPIHVDVHVTPDQLTRMVALVEGNWEALGRSEPHWSVITADRFKADEIDQNAQEFYETGRYSAGLMRIAASRCGLDIADLPICFELGCGVGRVSLWLARAFGQVICADISQPHLEVARRAAAQESLHTIDFRHVGTLERLAQIPPFDAFFCLIVLQHNPPPVIAAILDIVFSRLRPGGVAYFQVPTYCRGYRFDAADYLAGAKVTGGMEMHVLPQHMVIELMARHGLHLLEMREDTSTGAAEFISNSFLAQKQG